MSDIVKNLIRIADACRRKDGYDIPLGTTLREAADEIERLLAERQRHAEVMEDVRKVLEPLAARCDEAVRPDDSDTSALTVKVGHLRAVRALLSRMEER